MSAFQKGIVYASWLPGEYSSAASDRTLAQSIKPLGANWIAIVVTCYQKRVTSTQIQCQPQSSTPTDADLIHVIADAHRAGLRVMLKPHLDLADNSRQWRGKIGFGGNNTSWQAWFSSYSEFIAHYAQLAQDTGTDYFVVGTELAKTTHRSDEWRAVIRTVRKIYSGPLTYAAHHATEEYGINWWDALDAIGIDAYYPLAQNDHPTVAQIKAVWTPIVARLGRLSKKWGRPVILTEVGYESLAGANRTPWQVKGNTIEFEEQADSYQALFEAFAGQEWWHGVFWWVWTVNTSQENAFNDNFTAYNKPAGDVLRKNYLEPSHLSSTPAAKLAAAEANKPLTIYRDRLGAGWENWSWNAAVELAFRETTQSKNTSLKVAIKPWGALSLHHPGTDTSPYRWLEFYIYAGKNTRQRITVSCNGEADRELPQRIALPDPGYLEGGKFRADKWQRVRIPLGKIGAANTIITRLNIKDNSGKYLKEFLIDEISLTNAATP